MAERAVPEVSSTDLNNGVIFPKKGIFELKKVAEESSGEIMLTFLDNSAVVKKGDTLVLMRLVEGYFPDYTRVMPTDNDKTVTINRDNFFHPCAGWPSFQRKIQGIVMTIKEV